MIRDQKRDPRIACPMVFRIFSPASMQIRRPRTLSLFFAVALLFLLFTSDSYAWASDSSSADVAALIQRLVLAQKSYDPASIKEITADNYVEVSPLGEVDTRKAVLGFYDPSQRVDVPSASVTDLDIRVVGDTAIAIVAIRYVVAAPGQPSHEVAMRATFVAMRSQNAWKLLSAQYTTIHPKGPQH